jgi:hypothetical protein
MVIQFGISPHVSSSIRFHTYMSMNYAFVLRLTILGRCLSTDGASALNGVESSPFCVTTTYIETIPPEIPIDSTSAIRGEDVKSGSNGRTTRKRSRLRGQIP